MTNTLKINNFNVGISEYGDPDGIPVFYFHGFPGSRLDGNLFDFDKRIASEIPNCKSTFIENEGHFSLAGNYMKNILNELKE